MKKTLAIVLALVMVLCMIPALSAATAQSVSGKSYDLQVWQVSPAGGYTSLKAATKVNSLTVEYKDVEEVTTGYFEKDAKMGIVEVKGFAFADPTKVESITINGKKLDVDEYAVYADHTGALGAGQINFPVELADGGYSISYSIVVVSTENDVKTTETAEISLKLVDKTATKKTQKIATITDIKVANDVAAEAYIVGSKIYVDYENEPETTEIKLTFANENKAAFTKVVWAKETKINGFNLKANKDTRLSSSAATYTFIPTAYENKAIYAKLNDGAGDEVLVAEDGVYFLDKDYTIVVRTNVHDADPKGIYLEKAEATIAVGEEYVPVVKAASNGAVLKPSKLFIYDSYGNENTTVLDYVGDKYSAKIIGVKPGVAYIKALYEKNYNVGKFAYTSSAQKVTVTLPGTSVPPQTEDYIVTCRNLNVRAGAGTSFAKKGMIHRGDVVKVVKIANGWAELDNGTFVCAKYITKK